jgi:hypothetical protein
MGPRPLRGIFPKFFRDPIFRLFPIAFLYCLIPGSATAQTTTTANRDPQAVLLLQRSLSALSGGVAIQNVKLAGNVRRVAGSLDESGTVTLEGVASGQTRVDIVLPSGERREVRDQSSDGRTGSWSGPDGSWHPVAGHNLWTGRTWFFPALVIARALADADYAISAAKAEKFGGANVEHITVTQQYDGAVKLPALLQKISRIDIYLDSSTLLPAGIAFDVHPDNASSTDIPVKIEYSDYRQSAGALVPDHIQRYVQNGLVLDVTVNGVQVNTDLPDSDFQAQ